MKSQAVRTLHPSLNLICLEENNRSHLDHFVVSVLSLDCFRVGSSSTRKLERSTTRDNTRGFSTFRPRGFRTALARGFGFGRKCSMKSQAVRTLRPSLNLICLEENNKTHGDHKVVAVLNRCIYSPYISGFRSWEANPLK